MKARDEIITLLNDLLTKELTAINQYLAQAEMCANWGYERLASKLREASAEEREHANEIIGRILFLEGEPNLERYDPLAIGGTVREQLENALRLELAASAFLNQAIVTARDAGDNATEDLLTRILVSEEQDVDWIETQLELMRQVGEPNYLAQQLS